MAQTAENDFPTRRGGKSPSAFRTISEVASELDVPQHVLRFWETKFNQVRPLKRGGGRRYYRPEDIDLLRRIRELLYTEGYTIKGVQRLLRDGGGKAAVSRAAPNRKPMVRSGGDGAEGIDPALRRELRALLNELVEIRKMLEG